MQASWVCSMSTERPCARVTCQRNGWKLGDGAGGVLMVLVLVQPEDQHRGWSELWAAGRLVLEVPCQRVRCL